MFLDIDATEPVLVLFRNTGAVIVNCSQPEELSSKDNDKIKVTGWNIDSKQLTDSAHRKTFANHLATFRNDLNDYLRNGGKIDRARNILYQDDALQEIVVKFLRNCKESGLNAIIDHPTPNNSSALTKIRVLPPPLSAASTLKNKPEAALERPTFIQKIVKGTNKAKRTIHQSIDRNCDLSKGITILAVGLTRLEKQKLSRVVEKIRTKVQGVACCPQDRKTTRDHLRRFCEASIFTRSTFKPDSVLMLVQEDKLPERFQGRCVFAVVPRLPSSCSPFPH